MSLGKCVSWKCEEMGGEPGVLVPLVSNDGSAWLADVCPRCLCSWWHQVPKSPHDGAVMTQAQLEALRGEGGTRMAYAPQAGNGAEGE